MKKFLIITGIVIVVLILILAIVPFLFKGKIVESVKAAANENLNATLNFDDLGLTFFRHFPDVTLVLDNLTIVNQAPFEGDTLVQMPSFRIVVDVFSLIGSDAMRIESVSMEKPDVYLHILKSGETNWDIMKEEAVDTTTAPADTAAEGVNFALQEYSIEKGTVVFRDDSTNLLMTITELDHEGSGDFAKDIFTLHTKTDLKLSAEYADVNYLNEAPASLDAEIAIDLENLKFTMRDNELRIKNIGLVFEGFVQMYEENDDINIDLAFNAKDADFKDIMEFIPAVYLKDYEDVKSSGKLSLNGTIKGMYTDEKIPGFNMQLFVENGSFEAPDMPSSMSHVNVDLVVSNPGGEFDQTVVNLKKLNFDIAGEPFTAEMLLKNPVSDPLVNATLKGKIDLGNINSILELEEGASVSGVINTDLKVTGKLSALEKEDARGFNATGQVGLTNIAYQAKTLPEKILLSKGSLSFTPQKVNLDQFNAKIGEGDIRATGTLDNVILYALKDQTLKGWLNVNSTFFNLNPWMSEEGSAGAGQGKPQELEAVELPANIELHMTANFKKLLYDNLELENVNGKLVMKDQILTLEKLNMNVLNGSMLADGTYDGRKPKEPKIDFNLKIDQLPFAQAFEKFVTVQKFAPMAQFMEGAFNAQFKLSSDLNNNLMPEWNSVAGAGKLDIAKATIKGFDPLNKIADAVKFTPLRNPALNNIHPNFKIESGRFILDPFEMQVEDTKIAVSGSNGIDKSIDYTLGIVMPASRLKSETAPFLTKLFGKQTDLGQAETVTVDVDVKGTFSNPKITTSLADVVQSTVKNKIEEKKEDLKKNLEDEAKKKLKDLFNPGKK